ncbi:MAG: peptide chain release factor N(5)-glutamine methyltransferase [candidate division WS1 bacterium]|nr:peptide chain release factor N(5)-glutamine methyltransferase [candidate division WS1 bacterium]
MSCLTVRDLYREACRRLVEAGVDSPEWDARALLLEMLHMDEVGLLLSQQQTVPPPVLESFLALVARRAEREPLAYILGRVEFHGLRFACDARALVPRQETEILVERAHHWCKALPPGSLVVDVGTGSGVIALVLAALNSQLVAWGTDISAQALQLAAENARYYHLQGRVHWARGPGLQPLYEAGVAEQVAVVVSNPPYVRSGDYAKLQPEIRQHEPRGALDGGADGLEVYRALLADCASLPRLEAVCLEIGAAQAEAVTTLALDYLPAASVKVFADLAGLARVVELSLSTTGRTTTHDRMVAEGV